MRKLPKTSSQLPAAAERRELSTTLSVMPRDVGELAEPLRAHRDGEQSSVRAGNAESPDLV